MTEVARGKRQCKTCLYYMDRPEWQDDGCKLPVCECRSQDKLFGIALCENYVPQQYIDASGMCLEGSATGMCGWKAPPVLTKVLWYEGRYRAVNKDTSWCHCWEEQRELTIRMSTRQKRLEEPKAPVIIDDR